jgi:hypothetical protein
VKWFWFLAFCAIAMVAAQDVYPGQSLYHYGWYSAIDIALLVLCAQNLRHNPNRGHVLATFGTAVVVFTGVAAGLMGPDTQTVIGAPAASVRNDDVGGVFVFPLTANAPVQLQRANTAVSIGASRRYSGGLVMWRQPRTVVYVDVADAHANHLTITQPTNASFLSPVLLMEQTTTIAGMNVRFDSFAVPAARRTVRAVLFSQQQAAQLHGSAPLEGSSAVLFSVQDDADRSVPHGIGIVASGERRLIGGLLLRATVETYPAIVVAAAPYLPVFIIGLLITGVGAASGGIRNPSRS